VVRHHKKPVFNQTHPMSRAQQPQPLKPAPAVSTFTAASIFAKFQVSSFKFSGRHLSAFVCALFALFAVQSFSATVTNLMWDISGAPIDRTVKFYPQSTPNTISWNGTNATVMDVQKSVTSTNGAWAQRFVGGIYWADFGTINNGVKTDPVAFLVPPNDSSTYDFNYCANLATNLGTFVWTNPPGSMGTATNLTGNATNQVNSLALAVAQSVVNTNAGGGGSGGATNGGGILSGMLTNASFSLIGTQAIQGVIKDLGAVTNRNAQSVRLDGGTHIQNTFIVSNELTGYGMAYHYDLAQLKIIGSNYLSGASVPGTIFLQGHSPDGSLGNYFTVGEYCSSDIGFGDEDRVGTLVWKSYGREPLDDNIIYGGGGWLLGARTSYTNQITAGDFAWGLFQSPDGRMQFGNLPNNYDATKPPTFAAWNAFHGDSTNATFNIALFYFRPSPLPAGLQTNIFHYDGDSLWLGDSNGVASKIPSTIKSNNFTGGLYANGAAVLTSVPLSLGFGGMRTFSGNSSSSAYVYTSVFGAYDTATAANVGTVIQPGTYTNFFGSHVYPAFTGTNFYIIFTNNGSGTLVEAMRAWRINATANSQNLWSNTTSSFRVSVPTIAYIAQSNSFGTIAAPFVNWSIQKY
jgi:hypothetical protein